MSKCSTAEVEKLLLTVLKDGREIGPALALRGLLALEKGRLSKAGEDAGPHEAVHALLKDHPLGWWWRRRPRRID